MPFRTLNFGISGDKIQNVLRCVCNMTLPASVEYVIIHCGTNNLGHKSPLKIAEELINIACILKKNYKNLHIFVSCILPRDDKKSVKRSLLYAVNCYLKEFCTNQLHYIDLDLDWTVNNHLNTELFHSDDLHLNRKGYEKLSKLFMGKIESLQITLRLRNLKTSRNYTEAVSFSIVDEQFPSLLSVSRNFSKPVCPVSVCKPLPAVNPSKHYIREPIRSVNSNTLVRRVNSSNFVHPVDIRTADCNKPLHPVICSIRPVHPVNVCKTIPSVNSNKIARTVTSDKPINSNVVRPVNSSKTMYPVNSSKPERLVDVCKFVRPFNSNKPGCPINSNTLERSVNSSNFVHHVYIRTADCNKPLRPVINSSKSVCPVNVCKAIRPVPINL